MKENLLSLHGYDIGRSNLRTLFDAARAAGYEAAEPNIMQINYFLNAGYTTKDIREMAGELILPAIGWLDNCERQGHAFLELMKEAEYTFRIASEIGAKAVEVINGPFDPKAVKCFRDGTPYSGYMGLLGLDFEDQMAITQKNLSALADLAAQFGLTIYFEPLCWLPIHSLKESTKLVERAQRDNFKVVIDFFHNALAGVTAEDIAKIDPAMILGVHVCDALPCKAGEVPDEAVQRNVALGEGFVPVKEWVDAIKSTGFTGWWAYETLSRREHEEDPYAVAKRSYKTLTELILR